jgi:TetR/AcrR family transcriptional repressor of lmrAB and yxaGH operons
MTAVIVKGMERMSGESRQRMIESAVTLLAKRGLQATAFSDVIEHSGAPRGSIYHHFPGGKDELVDAAIDLAGDRALRVLDAVAGRPPAEVTGYFIELWRAVLVRSGLTAGCAVLAVTVATDSPELLEHAAAIFRAWRGRLAELYVSGGMSPAAAARLAVTVIAATEGAVVVSRAEQSLEPFEEVAGALLAMTPGAGSATERAERASEQAERAAGVRRRKPAQ